VLVAHVSLSLSVYRHGMGIHTGIDLDKLIDAGTFISNVLGRESRSKVARAMAARRAQA
jgi:hydroxymethylglutaryl-CoA lyase